MKAFTRSLLIAIALVALLSALLWFVPDERREEWLAMLPASQGKIAAPELLEGNKEQDDEVPQRLALIHGAPAVRLTVAEQQYSGIRTEPLERMSYRAESQVYGEVIDLQSLLKIRAQYIEAEAEREIAQARLQVSAQEYERLRGLNSQGNIISASRMREVQSRWQGDQARLTAAGMRARNIRAQAVQVWGTELTDEAFGAQSERMERLVNREEVLLRITLAPNQSLPKAGRTAFVERNGERHNAREAVFISPAPRTDLAAQGETYFFRAATDGLRTGMRVAAWIPQDEAPATGILLPAAAAIWYGGEPWVYVQVDEELFARRAVPAANEVAGGWLARDGFSLGAPLVVSGAQMLLSEEFRWQIPEEDDD